MKKKFFILLLLAGVFAVPVKAQFLQMGLKLQYSTESVDDMINNVQSEVQNFSTDFLKGCEAGVLL